MRPQHERPSTGLPDGSRVLNMQTAQKCSLVMLVNKVNFGEWVKRQRNYPNKTKNKNEKRKTK